MEQGNGSRSLQPTLVQLTRPVWRNTSLVTLPGRNKIEQLGVETLYAHVIDDNDEFSVTRATVLVIADVVLNCELVDLTFYQAFQ